MGAANSLLKINDFILKKKILSLREHYDLEDKTGTKLEEADGTSFSFQPSLPSWIPTVRS